jgi:hypothetical protein
MARGERLGLSRIRDIRRDPSRLTNQHDLDQRPGVDHGREFGGVKHRERNRASPISMI